MSNERSIEVPNCGNYIIPEDWPELEGDINLSVQDCPHASANTGMLLDISY